MRRALRNARPGVVTISEEVGVFTRTTMSVLAACVIVAATASPAVAQASPPKTIAGGYSVLRELDTPGATANDYTKGWFVSVGHPFALQRLSLVGEIGGNYRRNLLKEVQRLHAFLGGARFTVARSSRLTIFAQGLVGIERFAEPGFNESGIAVQPGGGVDLSLFKSVGVRVQGDYRIARQGDTNFKEARVVVGAVLAVGGP